MKHLATNILSSQHLSDITFLLLFASEFTYYLLILQTGIVTYHHSILSEIWMIPVGGILGIVASVALNKEKRWLMPLLLLIQLLLSFHYATANSLELFLLGIISGLTAPMLIARINTFWIVVGALALSYTFGTYLFDIDASHRTNIALILSLLAFVASLFPHTVSKTLKNTALPFYETSNIFLWLLLDAALFETLSRDTVMHLWGGSQFTWVIILFHIIGLMVAYILKDYKRNDKVLLILFALTYITYASGWQSALSILYPFVISYYNVIILRKLYRLSYANLAFVSLGLWGASGLGLFIALSHMFVLAWVAWLFLCLSYVWHKQDKFIMLLDISIFNPLHKLH